MISNLYCMLGYSYLRADEIKKSFYYFKKEFKICSKSSTRFQSCCNNLGTLYFKLKQYDKAIYYLEQASNSVYGITAAHTYFSLGFAYYRTNQLEKGQKFLEKSLEIFLTMDNTCAMLSQYILGRICRHLKLYDKALEYHEKALDIKIKVLKDNLINFNECNPDILYSFGFLYYDIGITLQKKGEYEKSIYYHEKGLSIFCKTFYMYDEYIDHVDLYKSLGIAYEKIGNKSKAIENYENTIFEFHAIFGANHKKTLSAIAKLKRIQES
ncbi:hypothetical protein RFI_02899 [Reticulomyxa filosa]|uniref:Tetratricopeptide repeat protein n=1 Tax=Reticulomyxa filosa TaxID=46433 RepID=X6P7M5_RETFI|nr:hypothetical protein RFI_02899 [Reticulomyxa filosa]|eukprot:ETO34196.1 hypothetical protein RFI_02899 [Reticulomyxa filosa]